MCCFLAFSHVGGPGHDIWRWWSYQSNNEYGSWSQSPGLRPRSHGTFSGRALSQGTLVSDLLININYTKTQVKAYFISCLDKCGYYIMFLLYNFFVLHSHLTAWPFGAVFCLWLLKHTVCEFCSSQYIFHLLPIKYSSPRYTTEFYRPIKSIPPS